MNLFKKTFRFILTGVLFAALSLALTGCSKDDKSSNATNGRNTGTSNLNLTQFLLTTSLSIGVCLSLEGFFLDALSARQASQV